MQWEFLWPSAQLGQAVKGSPPRKRGSSWYYSPKGIHVIIEFGSVMTEYGGRALARLAVSMLALMPRSQR